MLAWSKSWWPMATCFPLKAWAQRRPNFSAQSRPAPLEPAVTAPKAAGFTGLDTVSRNVEALKTSADNFEGKRSLATTRMFLFDIVERMFVRKMPELANHLRD
jgi:hypothetical protein